MENNVKLKSKTEAKSARYKQIGRILLIPPLFALLFGSALSEMAYFASFFNVNFSLNIGFYYFVAVLGTILLIDFVIGIPIGIYCLFKAKKIGIQKYDENSGKGKESLVPEEIKGWSWGAAGLTWLWGRLVIFSDDHSICKCYLLSCLGYSW